MDAVQVATRMTANEYLALPEAEYGLSADDTLTSPQLLGFELPLVTAFAEP